MPVADLLLEAMALSEAVRLVREVQLDEEAGEPLAMQSKLRDLANVFNERLSKMRLIHLLDEQRGRLVAGYDCADLLVAMWFQLSDQIGAGAVWQTCAGCGRLFARSRRDQRYHDEACRNRYAVRRHRERKGAQ